MNRRLMNPVLTDHPRCVGRDDGFSVPWPNKREETLTGALIRADAAHASKCTVSNISRLSAMSAHSTSTRLSYIFGMTGPISTSDTACSSSLVATLGLSLVAGDACCLRQQFSSSWLSSVLQPRTGEAHNAPCMQPSC